MMRRSDEVESNVAANRDRWDEDHTWAKDGDEWSGQAKLCGVPYEDWKASLVAHLIKPYVSSVSEIIEVAPGHGRWSEYLISVGSFVTLVDIAPGCLKHCMGRFGTAANVDYFLTDGTRLPHHATGRIDFIWSYDSFVHMTAGVIGAYMSEFARVLRPGAKAIIHHANVPNLAAHSQQQAEGWRSAVDNSMIRSFALNAGLTVAAQFSFWDEDRKIGVPRFGDSISILSAPPH